MGFNFSFRQVDSRKDISLLVEFILKQALGYPGYEGWVERTGYEIGSGYKHAILAFSDNRLVADTIYQPHKQLPRIMEVKNLRVHPEVEGRYFAKFMLRQAERENKGKYDALLVDVRTDRPEIVRFLRSEGYQPLIKSPLYDTNAEDLTMVKCLNKKSEQGILHTSKSFIQSISL